MKKYTTIFVMALAIMFVSSCSKEKTLAKRLEGTWAIDKMEGNFSNGGIATPFSFSNAGTMTFKDDNTGSYSFVILGQTTNANFNWTNTATTITVTESGQTPQIMTVTTNEKTKQVWTSTETDANGTTTSTTYTLSKK